MTYDVFISYSSKHKDAADAICHLLEANGIRCWIAPRDIQGGQQYGDVIETAIKESKICVLVFSKSAQESQWVNAEINLAFEQNKTIIPFKVEDAPIKGQIKLMLSQKHWIDAYPNYKEKFQDLVIAVSNALGGAGNAQPPLHPQQKERSTHTREWGKILLGIFASLIILLLFIIIGAKISKSKQEYHYDKNGIHVHIKGLSDSQKEATTSILDNMILIEGGVFTMGGTQEWGKIEQDSLSINPHEVALGNYYISKFEVSKKQWSAFLPTKDRCMSEDDVENTPIDMLSWEDAKLFADTLRAIIGLPFSLPTEAQWEYAASGGKKSHGYLFSGNNDPQEVGWTYADELQFAHQVGGKRYNELGIYDMTGNVSEWCADYFASYRDETQTNPQGPENGVNRVLRGGNYLQQDLLMLKVTTRQSCPPFVNRKATGMRLVINI